MNEANGKQLVVTEAVGIYAFQYRVVRTGWQNPESRNTEEILRNEDEPQVINSLSACDNYSGCPKTHMVNFLCYEELIPIWLNGNYDLRAQIL